MSNAAPLSQRVAAALEFDRRVNLHRFPVRVTSEAGMLVLEGTVQGIAAKRIAARTARELAGGDSEVIDALDVMPTQVLPDGEMLGALTRSLVWLSELKACGLRRRYRGNLESVRASQPGVACGEIDFAVKNGIIELAGSVASLSHRRIAEALAWWIAGCRNVINRLRVEPPEADNDDELADAVRLVLEIDPSLPEADVLGVGVKLGVVTLNGGVREEAQKRRAETDAWSVDGVREVLNAIQVLS